MNTIDFEVAFPYTLYIAFKYLVSLDTIRLPVRILFTRFVFIVARWGGSELVYTPARPHTALYADQQIAHSLRSAVELRLGKICGSFAQYLIGTL